MRRLAVGALGLVLFAAAASGCSAAIEPRSGSSSPPSSSPTTEAADATDAATVGEVASLVLEAPEGWATSQDGHVVAEHERDLTATDPEGRRVIHATDLDEEAYASLVPTATDGGMLSAGPEMVTVAGVDAIAVTFTDASASGRSVATTTVVADLGNGEAAVFVLQAPTDSADIDSMLTAIRPGG